MNTHEGLAIGHAMAEVAADNAGLTWREEAYEAFKNYALNTEYFMTEEVRRDNPDLPKPPDERAWGAIARQARKDGIIVAEGWMRATSPKVHGMVVTVWRSKIFKGEE
jgi:hypothetical protein